MVKSVVVSRQTCAKISEALREKAREGHDKRLRELEDELGV